MQNTHICTNTHACAFCYVCVNTLLKMGSLGNSFVGAISAVTNKASKGCLNLFVKGVPLHP